LVPLKIRLSIFTAFSEVDLLGKFETCKNILLQNMPKC